MGSPSKKISVPQLRDAPARGERLVMVTAYDYPMGRTADAAGWTSFWSAIRSPWSSSATPTRCPSPWTKCSTTRAVRRGVKRALLVADMPYGSFHLGVDQAVGNAIRFIKEAGAQAVKIEGARLELVEALGAAEVPVMAHLGLTPQSVHQFGGFKVQGRDDVARQQDPRRRPRRGGRRRLLAGPRMRPLGPRRRDVGAPEIPTIGIGAGADCDGQVLVYHDLLGIEERIAPRFVRRYAEQGVGAREAMAALPTTCGPADSRAPRRATGSGPRRPVARAGRKALADDHGSQCR